MRFPRFSIPWLLVGTFSGVLLSQCFVPAFMSSWFDRVRPQVYMIVGAATGAVFGLAIDIAINGRPKINWQFGLRTVLIAVVVLAIFCVVLRSFLELF